MKKVSIILLNYKGEDFNKACIDSILKQSYQNFEIVFVDNKSIDGSLKEVENGYQEIIKSGKMKIIKNSENYLFAKGNNIWVDHATKDSEYICLLNNDTTVPENRLGELVKWIQSDESLGAVSSLVLDKWYEKEILDIHLQKKMVTTSNLFWENVLKKVSEEEYQKGVYYTSYLSWCCFFYKKNIINHPFLDFYGIYAEDTYLSRILIKKWYKLAVCTKSIVYHLWSATMGKNPSSFKLFHGNKNQIINFLIFYNIRTKIKLSPLFLTTQLWHLFINAPLKRLYAKCKARIRILKNRKQIKNTRQMISREWENNNTYFIQQLSYKFIDQTPQWNVWKTTSKLIHIVNKIFKHYYKYLLYK